ncbi:MAG: NapC/NirT family cytochrome c [Candidatus Poribacteria bacterium]|nr:NapC/NirT family cytochrome c [Candidatus Poribacteria bacterium]
MMKKFTISLFIYIISVSTLFAEDPHEAIFLDNRFPSAKTCRPCHPQHYREWSVSPHAYAQMSPVFNTMQAAVSFLTNGTSNDFCIRCHTPVGTILGEAAGMSNLDRHPISRESITCIVCHRVNQTYGKVNARFSIAEGDLNQPVLGSTDGTIFKEAVADPKYSLDRMEYHRDVQRFFQLNESGFCGTCHDLTVINGFREIEAFSEYKSSPAAGRGVSCQDCHMGQAAGVYTEDEELNDSALCNSCHVEVDKDIPNYRTGPAAVVGGKETKPRKLTNHMFAGPDYSIIHPGIFPHNPNAEEMATISEWLTFDHEAGWGTDEFEDNVSDDYVFPERWAEIDDRYDARDILDEQFELLAEYWEEMVLLLRHGYQIAEIVTEKADEKKGIQFKVRVRNVTNGHNVPTSLNIVRMAFLQVTITDSEGAVVFQSGDLDPNGDVRDRHSIYVRNGQLSRDKQLFNLQSKVVTRHLKGGEHEQVLPVNFSPSPLPFSRPSTTSTVLTGHPRGVRIHKRSIKPLGSRWAKYKVKGNALTGKVPYKANIKLITGMFPINLIHALHVVGFDYGMSPRDIGDAIVERHVVVWEYEASIDTAKDVSQVSWKRADLAETVEKWGGEHENR